MCLTVSALIAVGAPRAVHIIWNLNLQNVVNKNIQKVRKEDQERVMRDYLLRNALCTSWSHLFKRVYL